MDALISKAALARTEEEVLTVWATWQATKKKERERDVAIRDAIIEVIKATGIEPETMDGKRLYVGNKKKTKCRDLYAALDAILEATNGDLEAVAEALSTNAIKPGHAKTLLGEKWGEHFDVTEELDLKTGKPKKELKLADGRYIRS